VYVGEDASTNSIATSLSWKQFEPFEENDQGLEKFGFRITGSREVEDFYVMCEEELDIWLQHLGRIMICIDLSEDYKITERIGVGSFATVYKALCLYNNSLHAVKSIAKEKLNTSARHQMIKNEIGILRTIAHDNIVSMHRVYEDPDYIHLVMELVEGDTLYGLILKLHKLEENEAAHLIRGVLESIKYLNTRNIMHRDLKLENILVTSANDVKVIDFGMATGMADCKARGLCGTLGYCAPEIFKQESYDSKVDVFSTGVVLYVLLSGRAPFHGISNEEKFESNVR
jgi:calcium-dependent protein kinase